MLNAGGLESKASGTDKEFQTSEAAMAAMAAAAAMGAVLLPCSSILRLSIFDTSQNCCRGSEHAPPCIPKATPGCTIR